MKLAHAKSIYFNINSGTHENRHLKSSDVKMVEIGTNGTACELLGDDGETKKPPIWKLFENLVAPESQR